MLCVSLVAMSLSCYVFFLEGPNCFVAFELTDTIAVELDGNALNLVKPLGWVGIGLFMFASCLLKVYYLKAKQIMDDVACGKLVPQRSHEGVVAGRKASLQKARQPSHLKNKAAKNAVETRKVAAKIVRTVI
jgi:hypothetical protein